VKKIDWKCFEKQRCKSNSNWRILNFAKVHDKIKKAGHVAWKGELKDTYEILVGNLKNLKGSWKVT
jgi:hypothetical protein